MEHVLRECHQPYYHDNTSLWNNAGFPDLWIPDPPTLWILENKSMKGRVSAEQALWLEVLRQCERIEVKVMRPDEYDEWSRRTWDGWQRRLNAGGQDPVTQLDATIRAERAKRTSQTKARRRGQGQLWRGKGR